MLRVDHRSRLFPRVVANVTDARLRHRLMAERPCRKPKVWSPPRRSCRHLAVAHPSSASIWPGNARERPQPEIERHSHRGRAPQQQHDNEGGPPRDTEQKQHHAAQHERHRKACPHQTIWPSGLFWLPLSSYIRRALQWSRVHLKSSLIMPRRPWFVSEAPN